MKLCTTTAGSFHSVCLNKCFLHLLVSWLENLSAPLSTKVSQKCWRMGWRTGSGYVYKHVHRCRICTVQVHICEWMFTLSFAPLPGCIPQTWVCMREVMDTNFLRYLTLTLAHCSFSQLWPWDCTLVQMSHKHRAQIWRRALPTPREYSIQL